MTTGRRRPLSLLSAYGTVPLGELSKGVERLLLHQHALTQHASWLSSSRGEPKQRPGGHRCCGSPYVRAPAAPAATCPAHLCVRLVQRLDDLCWRGLLPLEDLGLHLTPELLTRLGLGQLVRWGAHKGVRHPSMLDTEEFACLFVWGNAACRSYTCLPGPQHGRTDTWSVVCMHAERDTDSSSQFTGVPPPHTHTCPSGSCPYASMRASRVHLAPTRRAALAFRPAAQRSNSA